MIPEDIVQVIDVYNFPNGNIAFLQSRLGKLPENTLLEDDFGNRWLVKQHASTTGSVDHYAKIEMQESQGIFQYLIQNVEHDIALSKDSKLKLFRPG